MVTPPPRPTSLDFAPIRNVAIIAHVDHGKTTLVDAILRQCHLFRSNQQVPDLILDNNPLERERGITILAKNVSVRYHGIKINIIDTPGHADFSGEVERVLHMADGTLLLVDATEGPMPQTRFVLQKALEQNKHAIVVINKVDKADSQPDWVHEQVFDLFCQLGASEEQLNFPVLFGSARQGWMSADWKKPAPNLVPLLETIVHHIPPPENKKGGFQLQITNIDYSPYEGRLAIGRVSRGSLQTGMQLCVVRSNGSASLPAVVRNLYTFEGLDRQSVNTVFCGDLCAVSGMDDFEIGDTLAEAMSPEALPPLVIEQPTISMLFTVNNSPFCGRDGRFLTSRHLRERLEKETEKNLALRVQPSETPDAFVVHGRGVLHLSVLIETMRREGYEFQVAQPQVLTRMHDGLLLEPAEEFIAQVPAEHSGKVIDMVAVRKGELQAVDARGNRQLLRFLVPSRGLIGLRNQLLMATGGDCVLSHRFLRYVPWKGPLQSRMTGVLIAKESGRVTAYALEHLQDRGAFFVEPGDEVYEGQIVGEHIRAGDLLVNVVKTKKLNNMRASGSEEPVRLSSKKQMSLEECLEFIAEDELVEITPSHIRLRKKFLTAQERERQLKNLQASGKPIGSSYS
ncbi:MAG: translational GTPase TypA [Chitinophagales bacterium]|nr:translational GTPase TypA [Chitinophagales bacterium]MDW8427394.1 translational GTPase TypA [Chitinophagales bacterium]